MEVVEEIQFENERLAGEAIIGEAEGVACASPLDPASSGGYMVRGLDNLGNTCFFNSVLQNLLAMDRFRDHFLLSRCSEGPLTVALKELFTKIKAEEGTGKVINPKPLLGALCLKDSEYRGNEQHDSHELLVRLLDLLSTEESDMRKAEGQSGNSQSLTFVDSVFGGKISSTICCMDCGFSSTVYEPFLNLSLPVPTKKPIAKYPMHALGRKGEELMAIRSSRRRLGAEYISARLLASSSVRLSAENAADYTAQTSVNSNDIHGLLQRFKDLSLHVPPTNKPIPEKFLSVSRREKAKLMPKRGSKSQAKQISRNITLSTPTDDLQPLSECLEVSVPSSSSSCDSQLQDSPVTNYEQDVKDDGNGGTASPVGVSAEKEAAATKYNSSGQVETSLLCTSIGQDESKEFAETEIATSHGGDSSLGVHTRFVSCNSSNSDPSQVDDSDSPVSVESCLAHFTKPEILSGDNAWHCERCSGLELGKDEGEQTEADEVEPPVKVVVKRDATKRALIFNPPLLLTVHLNRFSQDDYGRLSKIRDQVVFQETMDLKPYMDSSAEIRGQGLYRLRGVVEHLGTMRGGHYVAYVRDNESAWYGVSDEDVHQVSLDDVLRCKAYMLFYELI
ncbi:hypothetical protein SAY86_012265 [Trapa natans]|uniref:Ubiquitin carboxyl-terminal hydrolase n=1 Tax=Trapa natans TaxID=22666 RepID=A0AAN7MCI4_TRANT|nr:hypothetical protein SAY86_012265 [Trapa natans]